MTVSAGDEYRILGTSLDELDDEGFREHARGVLREFCRLEIGDEDWRAFSERLAFVPSNAAALAARRRGRGCRRRRSRPPDVRPGRHAAALAVVLRYSWGLKEIDALIAPRRWRLPFERKWRETR